MDRACHGSLITNATIRHVAEALDAAVKKGHGLPTSKDRNAWDRVSSSILPGGSAASITTIQRCLDRHHRANILDSMSTPPQALIDYLGSKNIKSQSKGVKKGEAVRVIPTSQERMRFSKTPGGNVSRYNLQSPQGELDKLCETLAQYVSYPDLLRRAAMSSSRPPTPLSRPSSTIWQIMLASPPYPFPNLHPLISQFIPPCSTWKIDYSIVPSLDRFCKELNRP
jgi:hypothetical protein